MVASDDKSNLQITVDGMDYLETNPPTPEVVMPLVKAAGLAIPKTGLIAETLAKPALTGTGASNVKRIFEALART